MQCKQNKNGVKLLAAVMVFAMAFAGIVVMSDDSSAEDAATTYFKIGNTTYAGINEALANVKDGETIVMTGNYSGPGIGLFDADDTAKTFTIDLGGFTYDAGSPAVGSTGAQTQAAHIESQYTITIKNGKLTSSNPATADIKMIIQNYADLTLDNVVVDGSKMTTGYVMSNNCGEIHLKGTTNIIANDNVVAFDLYYWPSQGYTDGVQLYFDSNYNGKIVGNVELTSENGKETDAVSKNKMVISNGAVVSIDGTITDAISVPIEIEGTLKVSAGNTIDAYFTNTVDGKKNTADVNIVAGEDGLTISKGSIVISGTIDATNAVTINATGEVKINGEVAGTAGETGGLKITKTGNDSTVIIQDLTVSEGASLDIATEASVSGTLKVLGTVKTSESGKITVDEKAKMVVAGTIDGTVTNDGTIQITDPKAKIPSNIGGNGTVDSSAVAVDGTISGEFNTDTKFTQNQIITMTADTYLVEDTVLTIEGKLVIPEGVTLYIQDTARLVVSSSTGYVENNGTIVVESKVDVLKTTNNNTETVVEGSIAGALAIINGTLENNGTINLAYSEENPDTPNTNVSMNNNGNVVNNGEIVIGADSFLYMWNNIQNLGTITLDGTIMADNKSVIINSGKVILNGTLNMTGAATEGDKVLTIDLKTEDAVVEIVSFIQDDDIDYSGLVITSSIESKKLTINDSKPTVSINVKHGYSVSGLTVGAILVKDVKTESNAPDTYTRNLVISGNIVFSTDLENSNVKTPVKITTTGSTIVSDELNLAAGVDLEVGGDMLVSGKITSVKNNDHDSKITVTGQNKITVTGSIVANNQITGAVNAAYYKVAGTTTVTETHNYTTLDKAVSAGATKIDMLGTNSVDVDVAVPNGITVTVSGNITIKSDATVTFATGAVMKKGTSNVLIDNKYVVAVEGTLVFEDKKTGDKVPSDEIKSDVIREGEKDRTYTNITSALGSASSGDTVKLKDDATINRDTTINEGVTLDTNEKSVIVGNDATLTVNGTLFLNDGTLTLTPEVPEGETAAQAAGKLVLNGTLKSTSAISDDLEIAGAYYSISEKADTFYYVQPVSKAAPIIADVDDLTMTIKSFDTDMDIGSVSFAGTADDAATVIIVGKLKAGTVTIDNATVKFGAKEFTGTITNGVGTVALDGTASATFEIASANVDDVKTMTIAGAFNAAEKKTVTVSGDVSFKGFNANSAKIDGNVIVLKEGASVDDLTVNGTVTVNNTATLNTKTLSVYGTVDAKTASTSAAGSVKADTVFVGLGIKDVGANATISGAYTINDKMYVADGATIPKALVDGKKSLQVFVEDKLWMTVYAMDGTDSKTVQIKKIPVENVELEGWTIGNTTYEGKDASLPIKDGKAYAKIEYNVYTVSVQTAAGIDNVYMDGVLMPSTKTMNVSAGQHTISYTLANGYGGEATMLVNGEKVTGYTFNASGKYTDGATEYNIVLQGIEKTGYTPDAPDNTGSDDSGMSITDYLLIVLVVLIVIMAILVAVRMMRS